LTQGQIYLTLHPMNLVKLYTCPRSECWEQGERESYGPGRCGICGGPLVPWRQRRIILEVPPMLPGEPERDEPMNAQVVDTVNYIDWDSKQRVTREEPQRGRLLTLGQLCKLTGYTRQTIHRLRELGLPADRSLGRPLFFEPDVRHWLGEAVLSGKLRPSVPLRDMGLFKGQRVRIEGTEAVEAEKATRPKGGKRKGGHPPRRGD